MHEYSLTLDIIETATKRARDKDENAVVSEIHLVIGDVSGVSGESIKLYFDIISKGTACENAEIVIERVKPMLKCTGCGEMFLRKPFSFNCTYCDGEGVPTEIGREFLIKSIKI